MKLQYSEIINPATGEKIGQSEMTDSGKLKEIIHKAGIAQHEWAKLNLKKRIEIITKVRELITEQADEIAGIISKDNGKTKLEALATEVLPAAMAISYYCKNARRFLKEKRLKAGSIALINKRSLIHRHPFGVVGIISPWNYPFTIPFPK